MDSIVSCCGALPIATAEDGLTHMKDVVGLFSAVITHVALTYLSSAGQRGLWQNTVCGCIGLPRLIDPKLGLPVDSIFVNLHPDHGLMGCYQLSR